MAIDTAAPADTVTAPGRPHRALVLKAVRLLIALAIAASITYAVNRLWPDVRDTLLALNGWTIAASFVAAFSAIAANVKAWQAVLRELDHEVAMVEAG